MLHIFKCGNVIFVQKKQRNGLKVIDKVLAIYMTKIIKIILLVGGLCCAVKLCLAQDTHSQVFSELQTLLNQQAYQAAWDLATKNEDEYLGEPDFDYYYGLAALQVGEMQRAVFAFERVIINVPHWHEVRYMLAQTYFRVHNFQAAKKETEFLLLQTLADENLLQASEQLNLLAVTKLNKQQLYIQQFISVAMGVDSNVNAGTEEDSIFIPAVGDVLLSDTSKASDDNFVTLNYFSNINKPLNQKSKLHFSLAGIATQFQSISQYNRALGQLRGEYHYDFDTFRVHSGLQIAPLWLDQSLYRFDTAVLTGLGFDYADWQLNTQFHFGKIDNKADDNLDNKYHALSLSGSYQQKKLRHHLGYNYRTEKSDLSQAHHNSKNVHATHYRALFLVNDKWLTLGSIGFQSSDYKDVHPMFLTMRKDNMFTLNASIQYLASAKISYRLNLSHQDKSSNLNIFSYKRNEVKFTASYSF